MDEFLEGVVVDVCSRTFVIYSNEGDTKKVKCDTTEQFMDVLDVVLDKQILVLLNMLKFLWKSDEK